MMPELIKTEIRNADGTYRQASMIDVRKGDIYRVSVGKTISNVYKATGDAFYDDDGTATVEGGLLNPSPSGLIGLRITLVKNPTEYFVDDVEWRTTLLELSVDDLDALQGAVAEVIKEKKASI